MLSLNEEIPFGQGSAIHREGIILVSEYNNRTENLLLCQLGNFSFDVRTESEDYGSLKF